MRGYRASAGGAVTGAGRPAQRLMAIDTPAALTYNRLA